VWRVLTFLMFLVIAAGSLLALVLLLPSLKEGFGIEELPLFAGVTAALLALVVVWWLVQRGTRGALYWTGMAVLAVPLAAYAFLCVRVVANDWRGRRLARTVRVVSLREDEVRWPGLADPIGVRLDLELEHAIGLEGNVFPPKVVMAADPRPDYDDYFFGPMDRGVDATLEANVFQPGDPEIPRHLLLHPGRVRLSYELFPSILVRRDAGTLCLTDRGRTAGGQGLAISSGGNLGAAWFFAAPGGLIVDMSAPLTNGLRQWSALQAARDWRRLMRSLEPATLEAQGLRRCVPPRPGSFEVCYCGPDGEP
jgi:hypothetical protein